MTCKLAIVVLYGVCMSSCLDVAENRYELDKNVGKAVAFGHSVRIDQGHAVVRSIGERSLELWGQAPVWQGSLKTGEAGAGPWRLRLRNIMARGALEVREEGKEALMVTPLPRPWPTEGIWEVELAANTTYALTLSTPAQDDATTPWNFAVYADVQDRLDEVQDIYSVMASDPSLEFALISGDLTEQGEEEEFEQFQREMLTLPFPCFPTLGNHDIATSETRFGQYFGRGNTHFAYKGAHFTLLDSGNATIAAPVYEWIDQWMRQGQDAAHLVVMHIPPLDVNGYRNGAFANRAEAYKLLDRLNKGKVDLTVYGHVHTYAAFSNAGIPAIISGGGGAIPMRFDGIGRHYLRILVEPASGAFTSSLIRID